MPKHAAGVLPSPICLRQASSNDGVPSCLLERSARYFLARPSKAFLTSMSQFSLAVLLSGRTHLRMRSGALAARRSNLLHAWRIQTATSAKNVR
jgi:hypothetical protein